MKTLAHRAKRKARRDARKYRHWIQERYSYWNTVCDRARLHIALPIRFWDGVSNARVAPAIDYE
jgi:hypothetical protein